MKESKLKVAVISCGMIANAAHIPAYRSLSDKVDLAAVCDVNPVSAEQTAQRFQIPRWYTDAEEMLLKEKPDLVSVCTPNALHKKMAMLALSHGAHVACEKPIAFTYADAKEMFDYAKKVDRVLFACQVVRYNQEYQVAREFVEDGLLGDIYYSEFSRSAGGACPNGARFTGRTPTAAACCAIWGCICWTRLCGSWGGRNLPPSRARRLRTSRAMSGT